MKLSEQFIQLSQNDMRAVCGGDFAYDFGFFIRELGVFVMNGGQFGGPQAVALDLGLNYRPLH